MTFTSRQGGPLSNLLRRCFQHADEGDLSDLLRFGLTLALIRKIQNLPHRKYERACDRIGAHLIHLLQQALCHQTQQERLEAILTQVEAEEPEEVEQDQLILKKAPREMMYRLYGMTYQEFATRRAALKVADSGRPRQVSPKHEQAIWDSWHRHADLPYSRRFLQVARDTCLNLRTLWPVLRPALGLQETRRSLRLKPPSHLGAAAQPLSSTGQRA